MNIQAISFKDGNFYGCPKGIDIKEALSFIHGQKIPRVKIEEFEPLCLKGAESYIKVLKVLTDSELNALEFLPKKLIIVSE